MLYRIWRRQLNDIQEKIQAYDEDPAHYEKEDLTDYWKNRKPLTDELEAHYAIESETT